MKSESEVLEESLDPQDWSVMKELGHRMVDDIMDYLKTVRDRPVWQPIPETVKNRLDLPLPVKPEGPEKAYRDFLDNVLPHPMGNIHPRFWGWVIGTGTPLGALAEMLAATLNPNTGGAEHVANYVENQVIEWCKQMIGFPRRASGLLVSGGSMANLVGLTVARNTKAEFDLRVGGMTGAPRKMTLYGSTEMHSSLQKAVELLGLGSEALRKIQVNKNYEIDIATLQNSISADRAEGYHPFCIIGNAGTVNTGAFDDLETLADICRDEGMWFHVDGAFGALAVLSPELQKMVKGMEAADSLAFDLHKWMYMPYEVGCALVRSEESHRRTFSLTPEYLAHGGNRGLLAGSRWPSDYGIELSRGFKALKVWMSIKEHGIEKYTRLIYQNVRQASYLAALVDENPALERLAPAPLNIVCFRFKSDELDDEALNRLNQEILIQLHEKGIAAPSYTTLGGRYAIRAAITNHRSKRSDFALLVKEVTCLGNELRMAQSA